MPDIHWHVGEDKDQETIATATSPRRSRRSWIVIVIVVILGAGLGMAYRSIPEPAPRPTPSPTLRPTPTQVAVPAKLFDTIDREAQALADGDFEDYLRTRPQISAAELETQRQNFAAWGRPKDVGPLYAIIDFDLLSVSTNISYAWADMRQFRNGRYFRETRFYTGESDRWLRNPSPITPFWSGQEETLQTPHFHVTYAVDDREVISPTLRQMEEDYQSLCRDLGCVAAGQEPTFTVKVYGAARSYTFPVLTADGEIQLPSPRVAGFYESGRAYSWNMRAAYHALAKAIVERVYGSISFDRPGGGLLYEGSLWAIGHIDPLAAKYYNEWGNLTQKSLLSLEILWEIRRVESTSSALIQLNRLLRFVEQEYGASAVTRLLGAVSSAKSMSDAIERGLGVPFAEFDQKWQAWAKQNISQP